MRVLLEANADTNMVDAKGRTALRCAAEWLVSDDVIAQLVSSSDVNTKLLWAVGAYGRRGAVNVSVDEVRALVSDGADGGCVEHGGSGMTALMHAAKAGAPAAAVQVPHIAISRISPHLFYIATMYADAMPPPCRCSLKQDQT